MITLRLSGAEVPGTVVRVAEYEPLEIEVRTGTAFVHAPEVRLEGVLIGSPEVSAGDGVLSWRWTFRSESWCGRAILAVFVETEPVLLEVISVPSGSKYSEAEYDRMLDRVLAYGQGLAWGLAPGQGSGTEAEGEALGATHPAVVEQHLGPLMAALRVVLERPVLAQRPSDELVQFRPDLPVSPGEARWLASRPDSLGRIRSGDVRVTMRQWRRQDTWDHPANRYLVSVLQRLRKSLRRTSDALAIHASKPLVGEFEVGRARILARRTQEAAAAVDAALCNPVLARLAPGEFTEGTALVLADHPAYTRVAALSRRMLSPSVRLDDDGDLASGLRRSWDLFEIYCLFRLMEVLESKLGSGWTFWRAPLRHHVLSTPAHGLAWTASSATGEWRLLYQQRFGHGPAGAVTVTKGRLPDFVLAFHVGGTPVHWILIDAKYRTARSSIDEALESMHVYRDSLRWRDPPLRSVAPAGGFLLVPHVDAPCARFARPEFLKEHGIGLVEIGDDAAVGALLQASGITQW